MVYWLNLDSHPASHNFLMDMRELCSSPGKLWASLAFSGSVDKASQHPLVEY